MCLIIMQPAGKPIPPAHLENGWSHNPDGAGYMFVDSQSGKLVIRKPFFKLKELRKSYGTDYAAHGASSPFVIHFRYATHGGKTAENCHPHPLCGGSVGLAHNGILREFEPPYGAAISDTVHFCRTVLAYRRPQDVMDETFRSILAEMIGSGNKFVLLRDTRDVSIVNEEAGTWENGVWYSNTSFRTLATFGRFKRGNTRSYASVLPVAYREKKSDGVTLFSYGDGRAIDPWEDIETESAEDELIRLEDELNGMDEEWDKLSPEEQDEYMQIYVRMGELERQLDSRLRSAN